MADDYLLLSSRAKYDALVADVKDWREFRPILPADAPPRPMLLFIPNWDKIADQTKVP